MANTQRKRLKNKIERLRQIAERTSEQEAELLKTTEKLAQLELQPLAVVPNPPLQSSRRKKRNQFARRVNGGGASNQRSFSLPPVLNAASYMAALSTDARMGSTSAGRAWALKASHPPSNPKDYQGLPDFATASRNSPEYRTTFDINYDITMFTTAPSPISPTYSVQICMPDIPEVAFMYRVRDDQSGVWSNVRVVRTTTLDIPAAGATDNRKISMLGQGYSKYRGAACSITAILNAPGLADQGMVYVGQLTPEMRHSEETIGKIATPATSAAVSPVVSVDEFNFVYPPDEKTLIQACPSYYKEKAKCGAFAVQKFNESLMAPIFHPCGDDSVSSVIDAGASSIGSPNTFMTVAFSNSQEPEEATLALFTVDSRWVPPSGTISAVPAGAAGMHPSVSEPTGMSSVVIFFIGISNGTGTSAATISTVVNQSLDAYVPQNSGLVIYSHRAPMWDEQAIRFVAMLHQILNDGLPADANGFLDFLRSAFSWLKGSGKPVVDIVKALPIPGGALAGTIIDTAIDLGSKI